MFDPDHDLHIVHGESAAGSIALAHGIPVASLYADRDVLSFGPLVDVADPARWDQIRSRYWEGIQERQEGQFDSLYARVVADLPRFQSAQRIYLWLGSVVAEQFLLAWLVSVLEHHGVDTSRLRIPEIPDVESDGGRFPGSISIMNPEQIRGLRSWREPKPEEVNPLRSF